MIINRKISFPFITLICLTCFSVILGKNHIKPQHIATTTNSSKFQPNNPIKQKALQTETRKLDDDCSGFNDCFSCSFNYHCSWKSNQCQNEIKLIDWELKFESCIERSASCPPSKNYITDASLEFDFYSADYKESNLSCKWSVIVSAGYYIHISIDRNSVLFNVNIRIRYFWP